MSKHTSGFSLLQLSIILAILAVLGATLLPVDEAGEVNARAGRTTDKTAKIEKALRDFRTVYGRLPCPADGSLPIDDTNFGREAANAGNCTQGAPASNFDPTNDVSASALGYIVGGVVPVKTLHLPDDYAFDSFNRRYSYYVDRRATEAQSCQNLKAGRLNIVDNNNTLSSAIYTIISHGANGHGAFPSLGSTIANRINANSIDVDEVDNASMTNAFTLYFDDKFVKKPATPSNFDDLITTGNQCCFGKICKSLDPAYSGVDLVVSPTEGYVFDGAGNLIKVALNPPLTAPLQSVSFNSNNDILHGYNAGTHSFYQRFGNRFDVLPANPGIDMSGIHHAGGVYSSDAKYFAPIRVAGAGYQLYRQQADGSYALLPALPAPPTGIISDATFADDTGFLVLVSENNANNMAIYSINDSTDTFTRIADPAGAPDGNPNVNGVTFSPDDARYMVVTQDGAPRVIIYKRYGRGFTRLPDPAVLPASAAFSPRFSSDGNYLALRTANAPHLLVYKRNMDNFVAQAIAAPALPPVGHISFRK